MLPLRRFAVSLYICLVSLLLTGTAIVALSEEPAVPVRRAVQSIDNSARVTLHGNTHPLAIAANDRGPAPANMRADRLLLLLQRSAQQEAELQTYLHAVQDANSPSYHQWLTPEEFGRRFGVSDADLATVERWLAHQGFTLNQVTAGRVAIEFSGTFAQVENAFHTSLHHYVVNGQQHWANASDPQIPQALAPVVRGVVALHNFSPRSTAVRGPSGTFKPATNEIRPQLTQGNTTSGYTLYMAPADAATIYDTPTALNSAHSGTPYDGAGVTVGIAGDSNIDTEQVDNYRATFGLSARTTKVVVDGTDPRENGDAIEAYLDTEVASGIAPGADVVLYTAADAYLEPGLFLAIMRAIDSNAVDILNVSFGSCEAAQGAAGNQFIYNLWQQAAAQGISVTVSTGDSGSAGCDNPNTTTYAGNGLAVNALASTPYNIAVGGTDFDTLYSNFPSSFTEYVDVTNSKANHRSALSYIPEEPWNDSTVQGYNGLLANNVPWAFSNYSSMQNIVAAGGGASSCVTLNGSTCGGGYPVPTWQSSFATGNTGRNLPDVSLLAGNGLYGATWALCTDQDYISATQTQVDCAGTQTAGGSFNVTGVGGTSASAPAFAGILALAAQKNGGRLGQADYVLYKLAKSKYSTVFHDITTGNNSVSCWNGTPDCVTAGQGSQFLSGFDARVGYDEASGLGSVDAGQLISYWASAAATASTSSLTLNGSTSALTITHGDSVSVQISVSGSGGTPSGPVALVDTIDPATLPHNGAIDAFALSSGTINSTVRNLPGGSYNVSVHYGGDNTFAASDSNAIAVTVNAEGSTTDLKVNGYYDPLTGQVASTPYYGYLYVLGAQPYGGSSSLSAPDGVATGTVTFQNNTATLGTAALDSNGIAELITGMIPAGNNSLKASFPGDASFKASTSDAVPFTVQPALTSLIISSDKEAYQAGDAVTLTATFANGSGSKFLDSTGVAPTGTITFAANGTKTLGTATVMGTAGSSTSLAKASVAFTASGLASGSHNITASYSGDANYVAGSTQSPAFIQIINNSTTMTFKQSSASIKQNQTLNLTAILAASGGLPAPTGTVYFSVIKNSDFYSAWTSPQVALLNGAGSVTVPADALPLGTFTLTANYSGDSLYGTTYATGALTVTGSGTVTPTLNLTVPNTPVYNALPITLAVMGPSGDPVPTGSVMVSRSNNTWMLANGSASFTDYGVWNPGPNTLTIMYMGDSTYSSRSVTASFTNMALSNLTVSPQNPIVYVGDPVTFTISVAQASTLPAPTGTITLECGSYTSAATSLAAGTASITIPPNRLTIGSDTLRVSYTGDANYTALNGASYLVDVTSEPAGFKLAGNNLTVTAGASTGNTSTVAITPAGGFTGNITLTAQITGSPANAMNLPTLSLGSSGSVNISAPNGASALLTVTTTGRTRAMLQHAPGKQWLRAASGTALGCVLLLMIPRRRPWQKWLALSALCVALPGGISACGGGSGGSGGGGLSSGTTAGAYKITVTGTSGKVTATTTITVIVN